MLWAIDIGNTQTVVGIHDGEAWRAHYRFESDSLRTEDEWIALLKPLLDLHQLEVRATQVVLASVVPSATTTWKRLADRYLQAEAWELRTGQQVGLEVVYHPADGVGADRIANALGGLALADPPLILVDFGTATTLDAVDLRGAYVGGAIMTGIEVSMQALFQRTAKLPMIELSVAGPVIGKTTTEALQSGLVRGYVGAIEALIQAFRTELGDDARVIATGGLGKKFRDLCPSIESYDEWLTLEGLRVAASRWSPGAR
ncbi:MAG TPA: type III pantothenate kinase [Fimbriimonadaceae bacterium]|nr:type III pantothenate kinase [Fimbriimonadaceae bacterium]HRJ31956.1 type III pantothenate kinase [Fimbriimonadaceae bacterium]